MQWAVQLLGDGEPQARNTTIQEETLSPQAVPAGKRVSNKKMLLELCSLDFPSYREGLNAIFAEDRRPFDY